MIYTSGLEDVLGGCGEEAEEAEEAEEEGGSGKRTRGPCVDDSARGAAKWSTLEAKSEDGYRKSALGC